MIHKDSTEEITRIQAEYLRRDASCLNRQFSFQNPAFVYHMQEREWSILSLLRKEGVAIDKLEMLEIGCGTGHILQRFLQFGARKATGIDLMEHRIRTGIQQYPGLLLAVGDGAHLPYRDRAFNFVTQFMCISSVLDDNTRSIIAHEMLRVLKPGGIILSYDMREAPVPTRLLSLFFDHLVRLFCKKPALDTEENPTPTKPLNAKEIKKLFVGCQLKYRSASLHFGLARMAAHSRLGASLLSLIPWFRTHYLTVIRKPS
jgi:ubiquinone/menaquinone biosynthesis C-methylase UbiE